MPATMKMLVVDDNIQDRESLIAMVQTIDDFVPVIVAAEKLSDAFSKIREQHFDLVLLDLFLPETKGIETLSRMLKKAPDLPIVALTRFDDKASGIEAVGAGAQDYLIKGEIDEKLLHHAIRYAVERKKAELKIQQYARELEIRNEEYKRFAYVVSHDLRAPLRAMQGFADALLEDYRDVLDETGQEYAERVVKAALRMDELILDLLAYSRVTSTEIQLDKVSLQSCIEKVLELLTPMITEKKAQIVVSPDLPNVYGHESTLVHVLTNLIANGIKFVPAGTIPELTINSELSGNIVRVMVRDNGIGIDPTHQVKVFEVFERLHGSEEYPGTGIGLAIVKKGMQRMNGGCGVESEPGSGSVFWVKMRRD